MSADPLRQVAVVGRRLCEPPTGVGRYLECLLRHWGAAPEPFERFVVYCPAEPAIDPDVFRGPVELRIVPQRISPLWWENLQLPSRIPADALVFGAYTLPWTLAGRGVVANLGIYDSRPADFSRLARLRTTPFFQRAARRARAVVANSQSTRNDVVRYLGADPSRVEVTLLGADESLSPAADPDASAVPDDVRERYGIPQGPFFLFVGKLSKRRNVPLLIESFASASRSGVAENLLVVGPDYLRIQPLELAQAAGVGGRVVYRPHAPMSDLLHLYRAATALVLPSEHEGFSLTVPEAMACGTPAIVFDHASLENGLREAAYLVEPPTAEALTQALMRVSSDADLRARLRAAGSACARSFRWEQVSRRTLEVMARAAGFSE